MSEQPGAAQSEPVKRPSESPLLAGTGVIVSATPEHLNVSCPACAAPNEVGCFMPQYGGHQAVFSHIRRRDALAGKARP